MVCLNCISGRGSRSVQGTFRPAINVGGIMRRTWLALFLFLTLAVPVWAEPVRMDTSITQEEGTLTRSTDINKDEQPDHWWYSLRDGMVLKIERDLTYDGTVDARQWTFLRNKQTGKFEKIIYENVPIKKVERIDHYDTGGFLARVELATRGDEAVDVDIECHGDVLDQVQADLNADGIYDLVLTFDNGVFVKSTVVSPLAANLDINDLAAVQKWWQENFPKQYQRYSTVAKRFFMPKPKPVALQPEEQEEDEEEAEVDAEVEAE